MDDETLKVVGYVVSSTYRVKVMKAFDGKTKFPSELARDSGVKINHISAVLKQLKAKGLVEIINPEAKKGRLYRLTELGSQVAKELR